MKRWLARSLALCAFLIVLTFTASCGGGGGGGGESATNGSSTPAATAGLNFTQSNHSQQSDEGTYETPEPATLSMLISGIAGAGGYLLYRRRRRG